MQYVPIGCNRVCLPSRVRVQLSNKIRVRVGSVQHIYGSLRVRVRIFGPVKTSRQEYSIFILLLFLLYYALLSGQEYSISILLLFLLNYALLSGQEYSTFISLLFLLNYALLSRQEYSIFILLLFLLNYTLLSGQEYSIFILMLFLVYCACSQGRSTQYSYYCYVY